MQSSHKNWIVGLCVGASLGAVVFLTVYPRVYSLYFSKEAQLAKQMGMTPSSYIDARAIGKKANDQGRVTKTEIEDLRRLSNDSNHQIRMRAVTSLGKLGNSPDADVAVRIVRSKLRDEHWLVRQKALAGLAKLNQKDIADVAKAMLKDPSPEVQQQAQKILSSLSSNQGQ